MTALGAKDRRPIGVPRCVLELASGPLPRVKDGALASLIKRLAAKLTDMEVLEFINWRAKAAEHFVFNSSRSKVMLLTLQRSLALRPESGT